MYDRSEQDLLMASKEEDIESRKMYQIYHKLAQCQLKLKKRNHSINSLQCARKYLSNADVEHQNKIKFDIILEDSIKKISQRIIESKSLDVLDEELPSTQSVSSSRSNNFIPRKGILLIVLN